ncbi:MAG TPA: hypothetical protein PLU94_01530 [Methanoregulaceae archaeon]|nr:hypothetical protein [Methanoregulaceae archaeon]
MREFGSNPIPFLGILFIGEIGDPGSGGRITRHWLLGAVVDRKLLKVGQDGEREAGIPCIPANLKGRTGIILDIYSRFFCFDNEFSGAPDPEGVIDKFCGSSNSNRVFVRNFFVEFRVALCIVNIPSEGLKERIEEFPTQSGLVVFPFFIHNLMKFISLNEFENRLWDL